MMLTYRRVFIFTFLLLLLLVGFWSTTQYNFFHRYKQGDRIDSLNHIYVYYNGRVDHIAGRNTTPDGYNLGLQYQCVEFVKRYYYQRFSHKMPITYGHAKDYYSIAIKDGERNAQRNLLQYSNGGVTKPQYEDILVFKATTFNAFGHVAIIAEVRQDEIEIIQQNAGPFGYSRKTIGLNKKGDNWFVEDDNVLGWLRKP